MKKKSNEIGEQSASKKNENLVKTNKKLLHVAKELAHQQSLLAQLNLALYESEQRFELAFKYAPIGMGLVAPDGQWLKVNNSLCRLLKYSEEELLKLNFQKITYPEDLEKDLIHQQKMLSGEISIYQTEKRYIRKDGKVIWILLSVALARDKPSKLPLYFITQVQNIDEQKKAEAKLKKMADEDPLTGLLNRKSLATAFKKLKKKLPDHLCMGVYFFDLDYFKRVNDNQGHMIGDKILKIISKRLKNKFRPSDIIARIGGDEFVIVVTNLKDENEIAGIAKSLQTMISKPIKIDGVSFEITASIGISVYPRDGQCLRELMKKSDQALYQIKHNTRNDFKFC
ncbi:GGDEF domain-containing protein [Legionella yabuuchiae]|uniref:GGDEF domain-containing protein n=1 Tax=Legionella yabuuchiae TaxID=376727 RepID=UPI0013EF7596|nr:GGDEF domain-containing protein [Legionella yabuuchiae]